MNKLAYAIITIIVLVGTACSTDRSRTAFTANDLEEIWEREFPMVGQYRAGRESRIDSLKAVYTEADSLRPAFEAQLAIARAYNNYNADSALYYYIAAYRTAPGSVRSLIDAESASTRVMRGRMLRNDQLPDVEAVASDTTIGMTMRYDHLAASYNLYYILNYLGGADRQRQADSLISRLTRHTVLDSIDENSPLYALLEAHALGERGKPEMAAGSCMSMLNRVGPEHPFYSTLALECARYMQQIGLTDRWAEYTVKGTLSRLHMGDTYGTTSLGISHLLFELDNPEFAYQILAGAIDGAISGNAPMAAQIAANDLRQISRQLAESLQRRNTVLIVIIACLLLILVKLVANLLARRSMTDTSGCVPAPEPAERSFGTREMIGELQAYAVEYINLSCHYVENFESFKKLARRKISAGQTDEFYQMLGKSKTLALQNENVFEIFDRMFLRCYPNFVGEINALLQPDRRIENPGEGKLTNELRIFALMRLGIDDGLKIALFLGVTVNTVYTYRNKMRSRAIDRDRFEEAVGK